MALGYRTVRAAGSALLLAAVVGAGGMTGMASALAVDPSTVTLGGTIVDASGRGLAGVQLRIDEELPPDGGFAAFQVTTAADGSFTADLYAWGTAAAKATVSIKANDVLVTDGSCSRTWGVSQSLELALAEAAPEPVQVTATLIGEVCGTTGTPGNGGNSGGAGGVNLTPPPTDLSTSAVAPVAGRAGPALTVGFVVGLLLATLLLLPRPGARRRG